MGGVEKRAGRAAGTDSCVWQGEDISGRIRVERAEALPVRGDNVSVRRTPPSDPFCPRILREFCYIIIEGKQMIEIHDTIQFQQAEPSVVTLGKFDGLHRGHQKLIREVLRLQDMGYYGIAFTIAPEDSPALLTAQEKRDLFEAFGVDCMIRCPYIPEILGMEPEAFVSDVLIRQLKARYIVVGTDFRFGYRRRGDVKLLASLQGKYGFRLIVMEKERHDGREISSTYVKEALALADMELVNTLLGYACPVTG